ncbi:AAA family ATPase [Serratia marcescens]|uniref:AAA family ATPase n=1 Tax=Serratia marcescens TaxID=615 RepID=A0ABD5BHS1_SERMA|nr:AAA family ATPase [Serratia marcescens]MCZ6928706.1 DNA transposition protein [Serratia marcescens]MDE5234359.1 AAA family ATPase [Serratia marcescens]MDE5257474.1 AAA family ATPase [Serratia marcescens]MDQ9402314.1 AAA family ATPase [Serratia marcescens]MDQ9424635.1 AAA family ATPase [Serratia marcescens]
MTTVIELAQQQEAIADIRARVRTTVESSDVTYAAVAREVGISTSAISQFVKGEYRGDNNNVAGKLNVWLDNRNRRTNEMPTAPDFIITRTVKQIWDALQYAQLAQCITVIYGNSGVGKTRALQQFAESRPNVWLITVSPSRSSLSECLYELALELGIGDAPRRSGQLGRAIRRKLRGTNGIVMVDEADHLDYSVLEELRILQEETGVGLALIGNHQVYGKLTGGNSRNMDFARLFSRIAKKVSILKTKKADVDAIADAWGLANKAERELIQALSEKPGALRTISHTLRLASMFARGSNERLSEKHIRAAVKDLEGVSL